MKNTCISLDCPFIPICRHYNYLVDRGDECTVQAEILKNAKELEIKNEEITKQNRRSKHENRRFKRMGRI